MFQIRFAIFNGYYYDSETNWYYLGSRYYDPSICRFINADDVSTVTNSKTITDKNLYAYCDNNPVNRSDDDGEFWNFVIGAVVGAVIGGVSAAINGGGLKEIALGATTGAISGAISASGIGLVGQMAWGAGINVANTVIDKTIIKKQKLAASDLVEIGFDAVAGAGSALVSYGITKAASKSADKLVCKGVNKIVKAEQKAIQGQRYTNGAMKRGSKLLAEGIKQSNIVKGKSSIISSALTGCYSRAKYRVRGSLFQCRR